MKNYGLHYKKHTKKQKKKYEQGSDLIKNAIFVSNIAS